MASWRRHGIAIGLRLGGGPAIRRELGDLQRELGYAAGR
jgi:hypothetical protein